MVTKIMSKSKNKTKFKSRKRKSMKKKINNRSMKGGAAKPPASKSSVATNPALVAAVAGKASTMSTTGNSKMATGIDPSKMGGINPVTSEQILKNFQQEEQNYKNQSIEDIIKQYESMKFAGSSGVPFGRNNPQGAVIKRAMRKYGNHVAEMMKKYDADPKAVNAEKARLESIIDPKMAQKIDPKLAGIEPPKTSSLAQNSKLASSLTQPSPQSGSKSIYGNPKMTGMAPGPGKKPGMSSDPGKKMATGMASSPGKKMATGISGISGMSGKSFKR